MFLNILEEFLDFDKFLRLPKTKLRWALTESKEISVAAQEVLMLES